MIVIHTDSEASVELARIVSDPNTYKVSLDERSNNRVAIKQNERMWTAALETEYSTVSTKTDNNNDSDRYIYPWD